MITFKDNINGLNDDTCVKVYDPADKKLIGVYPNYLATGNKLGISPSLVQQKCAKKTRVFSTTIGHNNATVEDTRYLDLVTRGVLWSAGKLTDEGKPAEGFAK